jgi:uncharacterized membrane protein YecN with MAPEG domain
MITSLYVGILGLLFFVITMDTIRARQNNQISLGYGENNEIIAIVSAHSNFVAYFFIVMLMLYLCEASGVYPNILIHIFGAGFTLGRYLHYQAFKGKMNFKLRKVGMHLTLWPVLFLSVMNIVIYVKKSWM